MFIPSGKPRLHKMHGLLTRSCKLYMYIISNIYDPAHRQFAYLAPYIGAIIGGTQKSLKWGSSLQMMLQHSLRDYLNTLYGTTT